jgi:hypothetical protein
MLRPAPASRHFPARRSERAPGPSHRETQTRPPNHKPPPDPDPPGLHPPRGSIGPHPGGAPGPVGPDETPGRATPNHQATRRNPSLQPSGNPNHWAGPNRRNSDRLGLEQASTCRCFPSGHPRPSANPNRRNPDYLDAPRPAPTTSQPRAGPSLPPASTDGSPNARGNPEPGSNHQATPRPGRTPAARGSIRPRPCATPARRTRRNSGAGSSCHRDPRTGSPNHQSNPGPPKLQPPRVLRPSGNPNRIELPAGSISPDRPGFIGRSRPPGSPGAVRFNLPGIQPVPAQVEPPAPQSPSRPAIAFATWTDQFKPPRQTSQQDTPKPRPQASASSPCPPASPLAHTKPRTARGPLNTSRV